MKLKIIFLLVLLIGFCSCTDDFEEINRNPNDPTEVEPDYLLTTSVFETLNQFGGQMNRVVFFNYTHHFSGFQGQFQRYTFDPRELDNYWQRIYVNCLQPVHQIEENYGGDPNYQNRVAIARIWKAYIYSNAVSIWGGIPTNDALKGSPGVAYEKEEEVYYALLDELKVLAASINPEGDKYSAAADKIYGGDLVKWKKFANTLRLRLAMRISAANPAVARAVVQEIYQDEQNTITSLNETAAVNWGLTSDTWSDLYNRAVFNFTANKATIPVLNESLVYHTVPYEDPRIGVYAQPAKQGPQKGKYFGQNISYGGGNEYAGGLDNPHRGLKQEDYSQIGERFLKPDAEYVFLSYAESAFLKSEAALKGWWGGQSAEQFYYQGIDASFRHYGLSAAQANAYKNTPGIQWGIAADTTGRKAEFQDWLRITSSYVPEGDYLRQIVMQHWLAIPMQGVDAWALIRRTRLLEFQPQFATYEGDHAYLPNRLPYAPSEYNTNPVEVQKASAALGGPDDLWTKLWFALPDKKNPFLPY
ncbi:SusD/RagB family nutrient-binding outer membrane lipoprotein [Pontibacter amylolyticus]|uniref:SusD/RagB family nutrient-binding outer membrane lipoprotein n=1 Tax=Pontibacter amylolyticus TaxID=1424080 RepID=A0ABQ1WDU4_9BACT|nr:SusD/RagB family nutrient-binding outer membrane lipoprotein [Pontibacter amylolyticus]GGG26080.1 hypothetical protein GCM10011323_32180 [Pontibacter amylolyticus]